MEKFHFKSQLLQLPHISEVDNYIDTNLDAPNVARAFVTLMEIHKNWF